MTVDAARLPSPLWLGLSRTRIELRQFFREYVGVVFIFAYPVMMFGIFASIFGGQDIQMGPGVSMEYGQYFLPGILATGMITTSFQSIAVNIATERDEGILKRLYGTPLPAISYFIGKIGLVLVTCIVETVVLLLVAAGPFGVPMPDTVEGWLTFLWVFFLGLAGGTALGVGFSSLMPSARTANAATIPIVLILQFTSGVFFPFFQIPEWMQSFASIFPLKWMAQGMRAVFLPDQAKILEVGDSWELSLVAIILAVWFVVGLVVSVRTFAWISRSQR